MISLAAFALANAKSDLGAAFKWLSGRSAGQLAFMALAAFALVQWFALAGERRHSAKLKAQVEKCVEARRADRATYERAQGDAALKNKQHVQRIERDQKEITDEVARDLNTRLERLRRELRQKAPAAGGSTQGPGAGTDGRSRPGVDEKAGMCLAPEDLLRAAENEERHDQLITWIERQLSVPRN